MIFLKLNETEKAILSVLSSDGRARTKKELAMDCHSIINERLSQVYYHTILKNMQRKKLINPIGKYPIFYIVNPKIVKNVNFYLEYEARIVKELNK